MFQFLYQLARDNKAVTAIEYALIAALIAVAAVSATQKVGRKLSKTFVTASKSLK